MHQLDELNVIKNLKLNADEQELLGLEYLYRAKYDMNSMYNFDVESRSTLSSLPYEYVNRTNAFEVLRLHKSLENKLNNYKNFVIKQIILEPNVVFDISVCDSNQQLDLCNYIKIRDSKSFYSSKRCETWSEELELILECLKQIKEANGSLVVAEMNDNPRC